MKPIFLSGYSDDYAKDCERLLVTLLRGLGPLAKSVYLIGGLTPRFIIKKRPPDVPRHAGTQDVDVVLDLQILTDIEAYHTLEDNLKRMGFTRGFNNKGDPVSWRWTIKTDHRATLVLELLADDPKHGGGKVQELKAEGNVSALNIPHSSMVVDFHEKVEVTAELFGGNGSASVIVQHADIVSFTCLKALAFADRAERKDAHDLIYCLQHFDGGIEVAASRFQRGLQGAHADVIRQTQQLLRKHFLDYDGVEGYLRDGPVAVARFEGDEDEETEEAKERRLYRQREVADVVERLLASIGA